MSKFINDEASASGSDASQANGLQMVWSDAKWRQLCDKIKKTIPNVMITETKAAHNIRHVVILPESSTGAELRIKHSEFTKMVDILGGPHLCVQLFTSTGDSASWSGYTGYIFLGIWYTPVCEKNSLNTHDKCITISMSRVNGVPYLQRFLLPENLPGLDIKR